MKGAFRVRSAKPKYNQTWDVALVLNYVKQLHPLQSLCLKDLTEKVIVLLALSTAHRAQTLASIKLSNICDTSNGL